MRCYIKAAADTSQAEARGKTSRAAAIFGLLLILFAAGCSKSPPAALDVPVYFTCDTEGRLEPCGCFAGQFGGLTRLKTVLDAEATTNALRVDVGDAVGGHEDYDLMEYRYVLQAFAAMNYDALNIGGREAQFTAKQLREIKQASPVTILGANLVDKITRQPIFDAYRIVQRGAFRIAIIGVLDPHGLPANPGDGVAVEDMEPAIERCLAELRGRADLTVLLAFTDEATLTRLAQEFFECQVILGGRVSQPAQELVRENRSLIYFVTNESRALGILRLRLVKGAVPQATASEIRLLHDKIPQDAAFVALMRNYREEVRHTRLALDDADDLNADMVPGVRTAATYVGTEKCLSCHVTAGATWLASAHAHSFATLIGRKADADPRCIGCHTTGFGSPTGYRRDFGETKLVNVGCESCHGPGSLHVRQKEGDATVNFVYRPLDAGDCQKCHQGEFSRPFDWNEFWPAIKHGNEPRTARINRTLSQ
jgi:hypothetical protein